MNHTLTIATWNVRRPLRPGDPCFDAIARKLRQLNADIWILTETHIDLSPDATYRAFESPQLPSHPQIKIRPEERTTMIWVRPDWDARAISTFADLPPNEVPPRTTLTYAVTSRATSPAACALVETPLGSLLIYGTVITWPNDLGPYGDDPTRKAGYADLQHESILAHREDWIRLRDTYSDTPLCVAGDLNTTLDGKRYPTKPCSDDLRKALSDNGMRHLTQSLDYAIDHICLSHRWAAHASDPYWWQTTYTDSPGNGPKPVSDHRGVSISITASGPL